RSALRDRCDAILVSDYGRGVALHAVVRDALVHRADRVPLVWDPHPRGGTPIPSAMLVTPNRAEAAAAGVMVHSCPDAVRAAETLCTRWGATGVAITLGRDGAVLGMPGQ